MSRVIEYVRIYTFIGLTWFAYHNKQTKIKILKIRLHFVFHILTELQVLFYIFILCLLFNKNVDALTETQKKKNCF